MDPDIIKDQDNDKVHFVEAEMQVNTVIARRCLNAYDQIVILNDSDMPVCASEANLMRTFSRKIETEE